MSDDISHLVEKISLSDESFKKSTRQGRMGNSKTSDRSDRATQEQVLDPRTRLILFKMINKGVFAELHGCISTGKEANVYRATTDEGKMLAVKVYKTAILAFRDRDRYVSGEYRFRQGYAKSNSRQMVRLWAEKETRNLKRIHRSGIPVPKPLYLKSHVLVMEFIGTLDGWSAPKLKEAKIDSEKYPDVYYHLLAYMRVLYQRCKLVHADLSEYNVLYHEDKLWLIDVSQSVEHDHPMSLDFLRMDIKNVNDYARRMGVEPFSERKVFKLVTDPPAGVAIETIEDLVQQFSTIPDEELTEQQMQDDAVFRKIYIPRNLNDVFDAERDVNKVVQGNSLELVYRDLLVLNESDPEIGSDLDVSCNSADSSSDFESDPDTPDFGAAEKEWAPRENTRKFINREANKERKQQVKEENRLRRETKIRKKDKKKIIAKSKARKQSWKS